MQGARLTQALNSLLEQDREVRVLVVDNAADPAVAVPAGIDTVRSEHRLTLGAARNLGLAETRTLNVMFWDADDRMLPGTIAFLEDALNQDRRRIAFGSAIVEAASGVRHRWPRPWLKHLVRLPSVLAAVDCVWSVFPTTGATLIRTEAAHRAGGFSDFDSGDDWCLGAALACSGRLGWSERPGRLYLLHSGSVWDTHATARHQLRHAAAVRARLRDSSVTPPWLRRLLPMVAVGQWTAVAAHVAVVALRGVRRGAN